MLEKALEGTAVDQNAIDQLLNEEEKAMEESRREAQQRRKKFVSNMKKMLLSAVTDFSRNFVDYGPPYEYEDPSLAMDLISVCAHPKMKLRKLHFLLNERVDPNIPDPEGSLKSNFQIFMLIISSLILLCMHRFVFHRFTLVRQKFTFYSDKNAPPCWRKTGCNK